MDGVFFEDRQLILRRYILMFLLAFLCVSATAQNNRFQINDELFRYMQFCNKHIKEPATLLRADTMFFRAKEIGDLKAQCLAKNLKVDHYYFTNQMPLFRIEMKKAQDFAIKTPYKQYYFAPWNRLILYYIKNYRCPEAIKEIKLYQVAAFKYKNDYAIGYSYTQLGNVYMILDRNREAIEMFKKCIDYSLHEKKIGNLVAVYLALGRNYTLVHEYDKAEEVFLKMLNFPSSDFDPAQEVMVRAELLKLAVRKRNEAIMKERYDELVECKKGVTLTGTAVSSYLAAIVDFHLAMGEYDEAERFVKQMDDKWQRYKNLRIVYDLKGDYENLYANMRQLANLNDSMASVSNFSKLSEMSKDYDQERLEYDNQQIELKTMEQMLQQSRSEQELQAEEERRARMELESRSMEMQAQSENLRRQQIELSRTKSERQRREARKAYVAEQDKLDKTLLTLLYAFSVVFVAGMVYYVVTRNRSKRRLEQERVSAVAAELEAEQANRQKSLFLQNVSHEIRTPLNAIVGFNELLNDEDAELEEEDRKEFLGLISENSEQLMNTINDILDLSKLESGKYIVRRDEILVPELCRMAMLSVREEGHEGVERKVMVSDECAGMTIATDCERVLQLLCNLLDNACKFTEHGSVTLSCEAVGAEPSRRVRMAVTDTGCGIPAEKSEAVFERFEKLDDFKVGTGLGLSICKSIARLLDGSVWLDADYSGGARFCFEFPLFQPVTEEN